jgi:hypothetical protein
VPRPQVVDVDPEARGEPLVELPLVAFERALRPLDDAIEDGEHLRLVELVELQHHRVVVAIAEAASRLVSNPHELEQLGLDLGADLLRGFPRPAALVLVLGLLENLAYAVVAQRFPVELGPEAGEPRRQRALQPHDPRDGLLRDLVRGVLVHEQDGLPVQQGVEAVALDRRLELPVGLGPGEHRADLGLKARDLILPAPLPGHVQLPLRLLASALQRLELRFESLDQPGELSLPHRETAALRASTMRSWSSASSCG